MNLTHLPEPSDLHHHFNSFRPLDWGRGPLPTTRQLAREFGPVATGKALALLTTAAALEPRITSEFLASVPPGAEPYQLVHRVKAPRSLARKVRREMRRGGSPEPKDVVRYTVLAAEPDDLVPAVVDTAYELGGRGWQTRSAVHSYVDGSRYKGMHVLFSVGDQPVELQIHSRESIWVKEQTTRWYEIERDPGQDAAARRSARDICVALSDSMRQPTGLLELDRLNGVPLTVRCLGTEPKRARRSAGRAEAPVVSPDTEHRIERRHGKDGIER